MNEHNVRRMVETTLLRNLSLSSTTRRFCLENDLEAEKILWSEFSEEILQVATIFSIRSEKTSLNICTLAAFFH